MSDLETKHALEQDWQDAGRPDLENAFEIRIPAEVVNFPFRVSIDQELQQTAPRLGLLTALLRTSAYGTNQVCSPIAPCMSALCSLPPFTYLLYCSLQSDVWRNCCKPTLHIRAFKTI